MKIAFVYNQQRSSSIEEAEFDGPQTIAAIARGIAHGNHQVINIEMTRDGLWINKLIEMNPDLIFNTAEGFHGISRESFAPIVFEQLKIPYVGSNAYSCILTLDKYISKQIATNAGVPAPEGHFISDNEDIEIIANEVNYPVFVKPNFEGSSKGITSDSLCHDQKSFIQYAKKCLRDFPDGIIVEKYIEGKDITVPYVSGIGKNGILDVIEYIGPKRSGHWIYDYDLKNIDDSSVGVKCPADIPDRAVNTINSYMKKLIKAFDICDMARADFRINEAGEVFFIEINALPSLQPDAGLFAASSQDGLTYEQTISTIVKSAIKRLKLKNKRSKASRTIIKRDPIVALVYNLKRLDKNDVNYEVEAEFDSESTVNSIKQAIKDNGYQVIPIEADRNLAQNLIEQKIDIVFNIAEGLNKQTREAQVPAVCDLLGIEHTGSDASCLAITLNKSLTSKLLQSEGMSTPKSKIYTKKINKISQPLRYPVIIKPNLEGTSKGIYENSVIDNDQSFISHINLMIERYKSQILCEEYISGREFTVGLVGGPNPHVLGILEIRFKSGNNKYPVYSFEAKQLDNQLDNKIFQMVCPPEIDPKLEKRLHEFAKKAFKISGCRDVARVDLRVDANGEIFFLEINPLPGLSPGFSDLTILAESHGVSYQDLIGHILRPSINRWRKSR